MVFEQFIFNQVFNNKPLNLDFSSYIVDQLVNELNRTAYEKFCMPYSSIKPYIHH